MASWPNHKNSRGGLLRLPLRCFAKSDVLGYFYHLFFLQRNTSAAKRYNHEHVFSRSPNEPTFGPTAVQECAIKCAYFIIALQSTLRTIRHRLVGEPLIFGWDGPLSFRYLGPLLRCQMETSERWSTCRSKHFDPLVSVLRKKLAARYYMASPRGIPFFGHLVFQHGLRGYA